MDTDAIPFPVQTTSIDSDSFTITEPNQTAVPKSNSLIALEQLSKKRKQPVVRKPKKQTWHWSMPEQFVPTREPETHSEREKQKLKRDTSWCIEYLVELGLILFGFGVAYYTYYYITAVPDPKTTYQTGVPFIDSMFKYIIAPLAKVRSWITPTGLPSGMIARIQAYPALFVLLTALTAVVFLLWNKTGFIQMANNATKMQASPTTHGLIAWEWASSIFALTISNLFGLSWIINPVYMIFGSIFIIVFSHCMAGITQLGLLGIVAYLFTGIDKFITTKSPFVTIPKPETPEETRKRLYDNCLETALKKAEKSGNSLNTPSINPLSIPVSNPLPVPIDSSTYNHDRAVCQSQDNLYGAKPSFLSKMNSVAYAILPFIREIILICFAVIKLVNGAMQTLGGRLFSYGMNGTIILGALAVMFMNMSTTPKEHHVIRATDILK